MKFERTAIALSLLLLFASRPPAPSAADAILDRNPKDYLALGMTRLRIASLSIEPPACNLGVNCSPAPRRSRCGRFHARNAWVPAPGQVAANGVCGTRSFFEVFANRLCSFPTCAMIGDPASEPDCVNPFDGPLLGDLDGNGMPSCDDNCVTDPGDVAAACGVTLPFPACDPSNSVSVNVGQDCSSGDLIPGNARCDLAPGTYGAVNVGRGARIEFGPGTTVICSLRAQTAARVTTSGVATILVSGKGSARFNDSVDVGSDCGVLHIVGEGGLVKFGRYGDYNLDACTVGGLLRFGHGNNLHGHFIGQTVASDISNDGRCCAEAVTTSTTTTSSTVTTGPTTSSTTTSTTATTALGSTSTSTTSSPNPSSTTTSSTATSSSTTTSSTLAAGTTTTTTLVPEPWTRTPGFYKNHPDATETILAGAAGLAVCGHRITNVGLDDGGSAIEALCISVQGDQRTQLLRQLLTAALTTAAGGAQFAGFATCDAVCQDPSASTGQLASCIDAADSFNQSGDNLRSPVDTGGPANPGPCQTAFTTSCTVLEPSSCAVP